MYADILRSYSSAGIGPSPGSSLGALNGNWRERTSGHREPVKLKLSLLSDIDPATRSMLNGQARANSYASMRAHADTFDQPEYIDRQWIRPDRSSGVTLAVVGIKRTAEPQWTAGRVKSEPSAASSASPPHYSQLSTMNNSSTFSPRPDSFFVNEPAGRARRDQQRGKGARSSVDVDDDDDELDEVFAPIVRVAGGLIDDTGSPSTGQTQQTVRTGPCQATSRAHHRTPSYQSVIAESSGTSIYAHHSSNPTYPTYSSSALLHSRPPLPYDNRRQQNTAGTAANQENALSRLLEKVTRDCATATAHGQLYDQACSYQPFRYNSYRQPSAITESRSEREKRVRRAAGPAVDEDVYIGAGDGKEVIWINSIGRDRKSDQYSRKRRESLEKLESLYTAAGENEAFLEKKQHSERSRSGKEKKIAPSVTAYYVEDIRTGEEGNRARVLDENGNGVKLRTAKSESSLRMAKPELHLSDREIYQIEIMNSGLSTSRVYVCQCLANLYFDDASSPSNSPTGGASTTCTDANSPWRHIDTGVPVLILETGSGNGWNGISKEQGPRRLLIRLAELGNGFKLWEDVIDAFSGYTVDRTFHTLATSSDANRRAGLSFDSQSAALKFHQHVREFSEELDNFTMGNNTGERGKRRNSRSIWTALRRMNLTDDSQSWNGSSRAGQLDSVTPTRRRQADWPAPQTHTVQLKKTEISQPCCFKHVTSLKPGDVLPSAVLVNSYPSAMSSSTGTLTRVNRAATIKSASSKSPQSTSAEDCDGVLLFPKRAQSCSQILMGHSQRWENDETDYNYGLTNGSKKSKENVTQVIPSSHRYALSTSVEQVPSTFHS